MAIFKKNSKLFIKRILLAGSSYKAKALLSVFRKKGCSYYSDKLVNDAYRYFFSSSTLSNASHGRFKSLRPKCPYAAVCL